LHQQSDISCQLAAISAQARTQASLSQLNNSSVKKNKTSLNSNCAIAILLNNSGNGNSKKLQKPS